MEDAPPLPTTPSPSPSFATALDMLRASITANFSFPAPTPISAAARAPLSSGRPSRWDVSFSPTQPDEDLQIVDKVTELVDDVEALARLSVTIIFGVGLDAPESDVVTQSVRDDVVRFLRWHYWRHELVEGDHILLLAHFGVTFWACEETWALQWMGHDFPFCYTPQCLLIRAGEVSHHRMMTGDISSLPPRTTPGEGSSRLRHDTAAATTDFSGPLLTDAEIIGVLPLPHQPPLSPRRFLDSDEQRRARTEDREEEEEATAKTAALVKDKAATLPLPSSMLPPSEAEQSSAAAVDPMQSVLQAVGNLSMNLASHITVVDARMAVMQANISTLFDAVKKVEETQKEAVAAASASRKRKREEEEKEREERKKEK